MQWFLISIRNTMDSTIFILILLIAAFEFFIDRPALKREGNIKDAKVTAFASIAWVVADIALVLIAGSVR